MMSRFRLWRCTRETGLLRFLTLLTISILLSLANGASASDWATSFGGLIGANASTQATATDASGNTYLAGYFDGAKLTLGSVTLARIGTQDAFVAKLDPSGTVLWARNFGGSSASVVGKGIAVDDSGNIYLGGYFQFANLTTPALAKVGTQDAFALKLDSSGATTWAKNFGGSSATAYGSAIAVDGSGNVYLGGYFTSANLTTPALTKIGTFDAFTLKLDTSGATTWARGFGGPGATALGQGIAVDGSGTVYLGGYFYNASLTTPALTKVGTQDAFALKLDSSGTTTWAKNFGGSGAYGWGQGIAVDGSGNVYLAGYFTSANLTTPPLTRVGTVDAFAFKLSSAGSTTWARNYGGSGASAYGQGITVDGAGTVYLGGYFKNANLTTPALAKAGTQDAFALKLDSSGATAWARNFGGSGATASGSGIAVDGSGSVYLGGYFSSADLTTPPLTKAGGQDTLALKLDSTGATTWARSFASTTPGNVNGYATAIDASGNTYLAGDFTSTTLTLGSVTLTRIGTQDAFAAKLDPSGTMLWARNFGGSGANAYGRGIAVDGSGTVYLGGNFTNASLTTPALARIGSIDAFAVKLDSSGVTTWAKNFGGSGATAYANSIAVDGTGNVYLAGYIQTANLTTPPLTRIGVDDAFALKLDSSGATTWARNFGGSGAYAYCNGVAVDGSGNVYLAGHFRTANLTNPALTKIGSFDALALKLDSSGATTWARNFGGSGASAYGKGIAVDGSGNVYLGGDFYVASLTNPALTLIGASDAFALKLDSNGATSWSRNFGGSGTTAYGNAIVVDNFGNAYLGGYFRTASLTTPPLTKIGTYDAFALKLSIAGTTSWARNYGGSAANAQGQGIAVDNTGSVHLVGTFYNAGLTTPPLVKTGNIDSFVIVARADTPPTATTGSASSVTITTATLNGTVNDNGAVTTASFDYGLTTSYGSTASGGTVAANSGATPVSAALSGLTCDTTYHFRVTATNAAGSATGNDATFTTGSCSATLTVSLPGTGGGSVNSDPAGIACSSGSAAGCSTSFTSGTQVTLTATPDWKSTFSGWGVPCSGTGSCLITMNGDSGVAATFAPVPRVRIPGPAPVDYASLQEAYDNSAPSDTLASRVYTFFEDLVLSRDIAVTLSCGMSDDFAGVVGYTTLHGSLTVGQGMATLSNLIIE